MRVLIVEGRETLGELWQAHVMRQGYRVDLVRTQDAAIGALQTAEYDVIVLALVLKEGAALAVSDFASYRQPDARVIFVSSASFFSDGSIFNHSPNARALFSCDGRPSDLAAMVEHYGRVG